ncbi:hypothetical protein FQN54_000196 [Arachnomyces sp. PD_36]|nr:hypothetical protein FQN54_000196 [Arachnomyces sp. PD_36]
MSNQQVGAVFEHVIKEVCQASQIDFEEGGVDQQTLKELQEGWQEKVSSLGVASFPWDPPPTTIPSNAPAPAPTPTPPPQQAQQQKQQLQQQQQQLQQQRQQQQTPPQPAPVAAPPIQPPPVSATNGSANGGSEPQVKPEPGYGDTLPALPPMNSLPPMSAQQRAANNLREKYGNAAQNQVNQLQAQSQGGATFPGQQQNPSQPGNSSLGNAQTDGASDAMAEWKAEVARRRLAAQQQDGASDRLLREQMKQLALQREGGGDMVPYDERYGPSSKARKLKGAATGLTPMGSTASSVTSGAIGSQYDGAEEEDEDAINSDLDDPDDLGPEDPEGEEGVGQVMLCTYDKVQRVKNKWKCTLKDGILTTGGKEYVFHKGQGEFEW